MAEQGGAPGMDEPNPQGSSRGGRGKRQSGGRAQGEPAPAGRTSSDDESGGPGVGPGESESMEDIVDKADEGESEGGAPQLETPARPAEPQSKTSSELLRFERRGHKRRR
jgi:hypothetical protein